MERAHYKRRYDETHKEERRARDLGKSLKLKEYKAEIEAASLMKLYYEATIEYLTARVAELEKERGETDRSTTYESEPITGPSTSNSKLPKEDQPAYKELRRRLEASENENYMLTLEIRQLQNQE